MQYVLLNYILTQLGVVSVCQHGECETLILTIYERYIFDSPLEQFLQEIQSSEMVACDPFNQQCEATTAIKTAS